MMICAAGLVSCSSNSSESGLAPEKSGANEVTIGKDGSNNPFAYSKDDIQKGNDGRVTGGKRSQFELKSESAYAKAGKNGPAQFQKSYQKEKWAGSRDFSTGSYKTASNRSSKRKSWFGRRKSSDANKVAGAAGQDFNTGSYRTGQANESGRTRTTGSSGYVDEQRNDGWRQIRVMDNKKYRSITMGQAKSLLGR